MSDIPNICLRTETQEIIYINQDVIMHMYEQSVLEWKQTFLTFFKVIYENNT